MAVILPVHFLALPSSSPFPKFPHSAPSSRSFKTRTLVTSSLSSSGSSSSMDLHEKGRKKFTEFPFVSDPHKDLMVDLVSAMENRLDARLQPCTLPLDVQHCLNESGTAEASLYVRSGQEFSPVDLILGSWLHCKLPTGAALNITSLSAYLNPSTDAPNFVIELIQSSATSLVFILDLPPRRDLILHPDYLKHFYENTQLDSQRKALEKLPEVKPYFSSSLYLRSVISPTAIMVTVEAGEGGPGRLEEIIKNHVDPVAKEVLGIWLDHCACADRVVEEDEKGHLEKRDKLMKSKFVEIDLASNFPRLFGPDITSRVVGAIQEVYNV